MAGYMTKLNGYVYNGAFVAGEKLQNGQFAEIADGAVVACKGAKDTVLRVAEKTSLWGMDALVLDVVSCGEDEVFFVENEWDINDQLIMTVENGVYAGVNVGDLVTPAAAGTVAKKA